MTELWPLPVRQIGRYRSTMTSTANMVEISALVGDTTRAMMLAMLMNGQALTSSELASLAHISRSTASGHLGKLAKARLLTVQQSGRNQYYRIASPMVARMLESISAVAALETPARYQPRSVPNDAIRFARTCYDHLAGQLGVAIADAFVKKKWIVLGADGGELRPKGRRFLTEFGADLSAKSSGRRLFCKACLDWSERRYHIGGFVGSEIWRCCLKHGWLTQQRGSRAVKITAAGYLSFRDLIGIESDLENRRPSRVQATTPSRVSSQASALPLSERQPALRRVRSC